MANEQNLRPIQKGDLSKEELKRRQSNGGKKSAQLRAERKSFREELLLLLQQDNTQEKISVAIIKKALKGNIKAFETIRDTIGEKPIDKQEIAMVDPPVIKDDI